MLPDWQRQSELILRRERKHEEESCVFYVPQEMVEPPEIPLF